MNIVIDIICSPVILNDVPQGRLVRWWEAQQICNQLPKCQSPEGQDNRKKWSWKQYLGIMARSQQQFWSSVPESHHHWIKVCQWLQRRVEEPGDKSKLSPIINFQKPCKAHVCNLDPPPLQTLPHHKNIGRFQVSEFFVWLVSFFKSKVFDKPV